MKNRDDLDSCRKLIKIMILINITAFYTWPWYLILLAINLLLYKTLDLEQKIYLFKKDEKVLEIKSLNQIGLLTLLILFISCIFIYYSLTGLLFTGQILWYQNNLSKTILVSTWVLILVLMLALLIIIQCAINIGVCSLLMNNFQLTNNQNPFLHYLILENLWSFWSIVGIISFIPISIFMFQKYQKLNFNTTLNMQ
ncbi:hypothetical protein [Williamsoniiplasma lucivorax]|uniref:hypothetical protein n=1 Tax=Williamsoniiplasma lucivorax TaxID=209274 RepID=UPI0011B0DD2B|nr:hypothetical protein [Williamsoniiplasma lucivorax]